MCRMLGYVTRPPAILADLLGEQDLKDSGFRVTCGPGLSQQVERGQNWIICGQSPWAAMLDITRGGGRGNPRSGKDGQHSIRQVPQPPRGLVINVLETESHEAAS